MMKIFLKAHLRASVRLILLCCATALLYSLWLLGLPLLLGSPRARSYWRHLNFRAWARATAAIIGMRINLRGVPPRGLFFLVANHLSYLDIVALAAITDGVFIAKREVASWPVIGMLCRSMGTIFIERTRRSSISEALPEIRQRLQQGAGVILFAEGTSTKGESVAPFKSSLLELAASERLPVSYASINYRTLARETPASDSLCWWGEMAFSPHFYKMLQLTRFDVAVTFGASPICCDDRKEPAKQLWSAVNAQFIPVL